MFANDWQELWILTHANNHSEAYGRLYTLRASATRRHDLSSPSETVPHISPISHLWRSVSLVGARSGVRSMVSSHGSPAFRGLPRPEGHEVPRTSVRASGETGPEPSGTFAAARFSISSSESMLLNVQQHWQSVAEFEPLNARRCSLSGWVRVFLGPGTSIFVALWGAHTHVKAAQHFFAPPLTPVLRSCGLTSWSTDQTIDASSWGHASLSEVRARSPFSNSVSSVSHLAS